MPEHMIPETTVVVTEPLEGNAVERWGRLIRDAVALRPERLVVDLQGSPSIDASAIVLLLQVHREMVRADGGLRLRGAAARVRRMLSLARVDQVLDVEDDSPGRNLAQAR